MPKARPVLIGWLVARLARLRFPVLFVVTATLFVANLVIPDAIPLADEILLGLGTALLARWRRRSEEHEESRGPDAGPAARSAPPRAPR